ncbi:MAG: molybdenum cofactor guanylyltransferase [Promethearchaeota archaeon]
MKDELENPKYLAILILIGGRSSRFGFDKGSIEFLGKPLILYQIDTLKQFDNDVFLVAHSANQVENYFKNFNIPKDKFIIDDNELLVYDKIRNPLIGIYSGLKYLKELNFEKAFVLSCDAPLIKPSVIEFMITQSKGYDAVIPRWKNGYLETLFTIYSVASALIKAKSLLDEEIYTLNELIDYNWKINFISVEEDIQPLDKNLVSLININGPIDIEKLKKFY